jgi:TRAP-type C4-dicarboxylate transport system permease small subunit
MQVVWRYVFNSPFMWTEELARDLGIWLVLLSISVVMKEERHLGFDIMPDKWKPTLRLITDGAVLFFSITLIVSSFRFVSVSLGRESPAIRMPLCILYLALPVGLALLLIFTVNGTIGHILSLKKSKDGES